MWNNSLKVTSPNKFWWLTLAVAVFLYIISWGIKLVSFFTTENVCCWFAVYDLYYVKVGSLYAHFLESFYHKWLLHLVKSIFCIYWHIAWFLFFNLLIWCITLIDLGILKNPWTPGINSTWSWCTVLSVCHWILFLVFCWGFLCLCSSVILPYNFFCVWYLCLVLVSRWWWPSIWMTVAL